VRDYRLHVVSDLVLRPKYVCRLVYNIHD
jgi:hypothetical protein